MMSTTWCNMYKQRSPQPNATLMATYLYHSFLLDAKNHAMKFLSGKMKTDCNKASTPKAEFSGVTHWNENGNGVHNLHSREDSHMTETPRCFHGFCGFPHWKINDKIIVLAAC
ncbi:hypothetical protein CEXT_248101 [Caerostris extrusa]|uniref:Uncharacterized protein n=1 Tax=Caerostris extrusa TaxID=172846 RepID=A0AAV4XV43_CAEEX|nr:hypothetical protein CEXT_248101 [Caerostris extrusa]